MDFVAIHTYRNQMFKTSSRIIWPLAIAIGVSKNPFEAQNYKKVFGDKRVPLECVQENVLININVTVVTSMCQHATSGMPARPNDPANTHK